MNKQKICLIVGHSNAAKGAVNYLNEYEYDFNLRIAKKVRDHLNRYLSDKLHVTVLHRPMGGPYVGIREELDQIKPDMTLELHFNAASVKAYGVEMLVYKDSLYSRLNLRIADVFTDEFAEEYGVRERHSVQLDGDSVADGVKYMSEGRGVHNLQVCHDAGVPVVMLFEPVFGNFETEESKAIFENESRYIAFLVRTIDKVRHMLVGNAFV